MRILPHWGTGTLRRCFSGAATARFPLTALGLDFSGWIFTSSGSTRRTTIHPYARQKTQLGIDCGLPPRNGFDSFRHRKRRPSTKFGLCTNFQGCHLHWPEKNSLFNFLSRLSSLGRGHGPLGFIIIASTKVTLENKNFLVCLLRTR